MEYDESGRCGHLRPPFDCKTYEIQTLPSLNTNSFIYNVGPNVHKGGVAVTRQPVEAPPAVGSQILLAGPSPKLHVQQSFHALGQRRQAPRSRFETRQSAFEHRLKNCNGFWPNGTASLLKTCTAKQEGDFDQAKGRAAEVISLWATFMDNPMAWAAD